MSIYDGLPNIYGSSELPSIYSGGCTDHPDIGFVFINTRVAILFGNQVSLIV